MPLHSKCANSLTLENLHSKGPTPASSDRGRRQTPTTADAAPISPSAGLFCLIIGLFCLIIGLFLPYNRSFLPYNRSLLPCNRSFLPYNRSFLPYNRSFLPDTIMVMWPCGACTHTHAHTRARARLRDRKETYRFKG